MRELTPLQRVINAYKESKGISIQDSGWDKHNYARYCRAGKSILECLGSWEKAAIYILGKGQELTDANLNWTLETIARMGWDDRANLLGEEEYGRALEQMGNNLEHKQDKPGRTARNGKQLQSAGEILAGGVLSQIRGANRPPHVTPLLVQGDESRGAELKDEEFR